MLNIGPMELLLILLVALIFVGPKKLPELGRTIGKSLRELRKAQDEVRSTLNFMDEPPKAAPRKAAPARPRPARPAETARPTAERDEPGNGAAGAAAGAAVGSPATETPERPAEPVGPDAPSEVGSAQDEPAVEPGVPPDVTEDVGSPEDVAPVDPPRSAEGE